MNSVPELKRQIAVLEQREKDARELLKKVAAQRDRSEMTAKAYREIIIGFLHADDLIADGVRVYLKEADTEDYEKKIAEFARKP